MIWRIRAGAPVPSDLQGSRPALSSSLLTCRYPIRFQGIFKVPMNFPFMIFVRFSRKNESPIRCMLLLMLRPSATTDGIRQQPRHERKNSGCGSRRKRNCARNSCRLAAGCARWPLWAKGSRSGRGRVHLPNKDSTLKAGVAT